MKKPTLRFKGFDGEWEDKPLNEVALINPKADIPKTFEYVDLESVVGTTMISHREEHKETAPSRAQRLAKNGDIFYQTVRPYQKNNYHFCKSANNYVFSTGYAQLRPSINGSFLFVALQNDDFVSEVLLNCTGTSYPAINSNELGKLMISYPLDKAEQIAIGSFFTELDALIEGKRVKLDKLKKLKLAYLGKMFPKKGAKVPEVRFKEFSENWIEKEAGVIFDSVVDKNHPDLPVLSATQDKGMIIRDYDVLNIQHNRQNEVGYKRVLPGQFVIHLRSFQGGFAHSSVEGITSPAYTVLDFHNKNEHSDLFWKYVFNSKSFVKRLELVTYGIRDGRSINYEEFLKMVFLVPSFPEQQKIGELFQNLDNLINLQQQELDKLSNIKSACLSKMFA